MDAMILKVLAVLAIVNIVLSALDAGLEKIKDATATDLDNKAYAIVHMISDGLQKIVQFLSANRPNPAPAQPAADPAVK